MRHLTFVRKDSSSVTGDCAAIIATDTAPINYTLGDRPGYAIQGVTLTDDELVDVRRLAASNNAGAGEHETFVWVPADVIDGS